jgi:hypothetical protein
MRRLNQENRSRILKNINKLTDLSANVVYWSIVVGSVYALVLMYSVSNNKHNSVPNNLNS